MKPIVELPCQIHYSVRYNLKSTCYKIRLLDITLQGREARSVARVSHVSSEMLDLVLISRPGTTYLGQVTFLLASCKNDLQKCLQNGPPLSSLYFLT